MSASHNFDATRVKEAIEEDSDLPNDPTDTNAWSSLQLCCLLNEIVAGSYGLLDIKYTSIINAKELLKTCPYLRKTLVAAWNNQNYNEVLDTQILRAEHRVSSASLAINVLSPEVKEKLLAAMSQPYQGVAADALYEYLEHNDRYFDDRKQGYYAKFCSVVQSSGTGKTRTVLELGRKGVLLLYINLRPRADQSGFPDRDEIPANILTGDCISGTDYHVQCCALFAAIFKLVRDDLSDRLKIHDTAAVESWNNDMCKLHSPYRAEFFKRLGREYNQIKNEMPVADTSISEVYVINIAEAKVLDHYINMNEMFKLAFRGATVNEPQLVIALDEAHPLHEPKQYSPATILCQVINSYSGKKYPRAAVWTLFVSTSSKVADFASPQTMFNSARVFPPFCETAWDQYAPRPSDVSPGEVAKAEHIIRYGRPLWMSLKEEHNLGCVFALAVEKLAATTAYQTSDPNQTLAVLSQRFCLDLCFGHRDANQFIETSVASHLRVCITTTEDCIWSYTTYPSEPFLSCAAAHLLHQDIRSLPQTLHTLTYDLNNGMIETGKPGELVSRLLWLIAKDLFVIHQKGSRDPFHRSVDDFNTELYHCSMIPVVEFFEFVFGEDFWSRRAGPEAKQAFKDAYVNFSHWISMESDIRQADTKNPQKQLSLNQWTMRHWHRTCAVQCCHNQPGIDKVIPIFFKSDKPGESGDHCMSQVLISDQAGAFKHSDAMNKMFRTDPTIGGPDQDCSKPYIAIIADLGLHEPSLEVTFPKWTSTLRPDDGPCLCIWACALDAKTYRFLENLPEVLKPLQDLVRQEMAEPERLFVEYSRDKMKYGNSAEARYMEWEKVLPDKEIDADTAGPSEYSKNKEAPQPAVKEASKKARGDKLDPDNQEMIMENQNEAARLERRQSTLESNRDSTRKRKAEGTDSNLENDDEKAMVVDGPEEV